MRAAAPQASHRARPACSATATERRSRRRRKHRERSRHGCDVLDLAVFGDREIQFHPTFDLVQIRLSRILRLYRLDELEIAGRRHIREELLAAHGSLQIVPRRIRFRGRKADRAGLIQPASRRLVLPRARARGAPWPPGGCPRSCIAAADRQLRGPGLARSAVVLGAVVCRLDNRSCRKRSSPFFSNCVQASASACRRAAASDNCAPPRCWTLPQCPWPLPASRKRAQNPARSMALCASASSSQRRAPSAPPARRRCRDRAATPAAHRRARCRVPAR